MLPLQYIRSKGCMQLSANPSPAGIKHAVILSQQYLRGALEIDEWRLDGMCCTIKQPIKLKKFPVETKIN